MLRFLRGVGGFVTAAKNTTTNLLFLVIVIAIAVAILTSEKPRIADSTALVIDPSGVIVEQKQVIDPVSKFLSGNYQDHEPETLLSDLQAAIEEGARDKRVNALILDLSNMTGAPMSMLQELGNDLREFKLTGKPVYAFGPGYSQGQYFLAAHADQVYLDENNFSALGGVFLTGLGTYPTYFKSALDKLKIRFHVFRVGEYKSAVEPFIRDDMSDASKTANRDWIGNLWQVYTNTIVSERDISQADFDRYTNEYDVLLGESGNDAMALAVNSGLVDELVSRDGFAATLKDIVGADGNKDYHRIGFRDYLTLTRPAIPVINPAANKIAVIRAKGTILDGEQPAGEIGGDTLAGLIKRARDDKTVKAVVLRVDSPGGSAAASELIRSELELAQAEGKPVVVSMSGAAASGGYWISATANKIFAQPTTITGSIGMFMIFPTLDEALDSIGVHSDGVGTTALSGSMNPMQPLNPVLERTLERTALHTYQKFIDLVAKGRDLTPERVDEIAQGRIWTGSQALELGLIDGIGTIDDAVQSAALLADVSEYEILVIEKELSPRERIINQLMNVSLETIYRASGDIAITFDGLSRISTELRPFLRMSQSPGIYLECIACRAL
ncbi:MAG: signal peptide peptidase SppA [Pseudomonadales bacterium]